MSQHFVIRLLQARSWADSSPGRLLVSLVFGSPDTVFRNMRSVLKARTTGSCFSLSQSTRFECKVRRVPGGCAASRPCPIVSL